MEPIVKFNCSKCGCCCKNIRMSSLTMFLDRGDGVCKFFDDSTFLCKVYNDRPSICRVDDAYIQFATKMSIEKYYSLNSEACEMLQEISKMAPESRQ